MASVMKSPAQGIGGPRPSARWSVPAVAALVAALAFAPYLRTAGHAFLHFDDDQYVTDNPVVRDGLSWAGVRWAFTTTHAANWHPLTWLSHMVDVQLFGLAAGAHHLVNAGLHAMNAALLALLLVRLTGAIGRSAAVAGIFAIHPLRVESVAWIAERKDLLSTLFGLAMLLAYARHAARPGWRRLGLVGCLLAGSLLAKPMWVTAPFLLLLLDLWPLGRIEDGAGVPGNATAPRLPLTRLLLEKVPLLLVSAASSAITVLAQRRGEAVETLEWLGLGARVTNAVVAYVRYLGMAVWPSRLAVYYPAAAGGPGAIEVAGAAALLAALTAWALWARRRSPWVTVGWFWFLGTLVPVIGIVQVGSQALADRYTYLPLIGIAVAVAWETERLARRLSLDSRALAAAAAAVILALGLVTVRQVAVWRNQETLFRHAVAVTDGNGFAELGLALELARQGRHGEALEHARQAVSLEPIWPEAHLALGRSAFALGAIDLSVAALEHTIALEPGLVEAHEALARSYERKGLVDLAMRELGIAIRLRAASAR